MGKQVIAALMCVVLLFTTWLVPLLGLVVAGLVDASAESFRSAIEPSAGVVLMPFFLAIGAGLCGFLALFHLKILYGTIALLGFSAMWMALLLFLNTPVVSALAGSITTLVLAALVGFGIWRVLRWVGVTEKSDANLVKEF